MDLVNLELADMMLSERSGTVVFRFGRGGKQRSVPLPLLPGVRSRHTSTHARHSLPYHVCRAIVASNSRSDCDPSSVSVKAVQSLGTSNFFCPAYDPAGQIILRSTNVSLSITVVFAFGCMWSFPLPL